MTGQRNAKALAVANPAATGSAGPAFETKVAAACLALLLTRGAPLCLGNGTLRTVHLQAGHLGLGWHTDDLVLEATSAAGEPMKAALQVKRAFSLSATDSECVRMLRGALDDFRNFEQFDRHRDVIALITSSLSARLARGLRTLLDCAQASITSADMARRLAIPGYLGKPTLEYHKTIREILSGVASGAPSEEELWQFLRRFRVVDLDLNVGSGFTETMLRSLLAATLPDGDASAADATWNELVALALCDAGRATSYTREKLPTDLLQRHGRVTGFSHGVARLLEDSAIVSDSIRMTIAEKTALPRRELTGALCRLIETSPLIFVTGAAGSGKSALVKSAFAVATQGAVGFAFRAVSLAGHHINDVLNPFGLSLAALQVQTAIHGKKVLWVDSLERLMEKPADQRTAFLDLLRAVKRDPTWRLVVTCRDYSAELVRNAFFNEVGLTPVGIEVGDLRDDELDGVTADFPDLEHPLGNSTLRSLLRNPFFLDMAAKMNWPATEPLPTTERAFREKVWSEVARRVGEDVESGLPNLRGQVLVEVALRRAKALEPFVAAAGLDSRALAGLVRDSLLQTPSPGSDLYAPAHDVFEDWALVRWLDDAFIRNGRKLDTLLDELGTYPALRRAYRKWLTETLDVDPQTTDSLVVALIQNPNVAAHWREDTLVGVLQSRDARGFLDRNKAILLDDRARLFRQVIHILRVACRAAIPRRSFGVDSAGEFFMPKGNGWIGVGELMEVALPFFTGTDLLLIVGFMEDWLLITKYGVPYPVGARSIVKFAWHWLPRIPWRSPVRDGQDRMLRVILALPLAAEPQLSESVAAAIAGDGEAADDTILKLIVNHFACDAVVRDLPDLSIRVAEHLFGLDQSLEQSISHDRYDDWDRGIQHAFGLGRRHSMEDYPSSAFHGPYLRMLWHHPVRGIDFILRLVNRACEAYAHPDNRCRSMAPPDTIILQLPDGPHEQYANWRLWVAYRGMHDTPDCFESALMALEYWLLEKSKHGDADLETILLGLLRRSNNVAVTAVVASVAAAHPGMAGEAAFALLTCRVFLGLDLDRSTQEPFLAAQIRGLGSMPQISAEKRLYDKERKESAGLEHRSRNLEYVAAVLQMFEEFRDRVCALIDSFKVELPPEPEQDQKTKLWRLQLHRMDTRRFIETGRTEEGHLIIGSGAPEPDLQELIDHQEPRSAAFNTSISLLHWGQSAFTGSVASDDWQEQLQRSQAHVATKSAFDAERDLAAGGPAYVAAVCIRDHWSEMSPDQQEWCAQTVLVFIDADADTTNDLIICAHNPMEGSRPAAFVLPALFGKEVSATIQSRLLPMLAKAVTHAVEETVRFAVRGIAQFLWTSDRELALTCIQALVTEAVERHAFAEEQRSRPILDRAPDGTFQEKLRLRMRDFVRTRGTANEPQIGDLDLAKWPGRGVAGHLLIIAAQNPGDPLTRRLMQRCVATLPSIWEANQRSSRRGREDRYDPQIEHDFVDAICRFVLQLNPGDGLVFLERIFAAAPRFPEQAAGVVNSLILKQGDRSPSPTLWALWQRFADDFGANVQAAKVDAEHSDEGKMLQELFLGDSWGELRDWLPLQGETERIRAFFRRLPPMARGFECYAYYLAKAGTPTLPAALMDVAAKLAEPSGSSPLNETALFYLEEVLTRLIYGGNSRIRSDGPLRDATLRILDALIEAGSSPAYKLRDDFLTPVAP